MKTFLRNCWLHRNTTFVVQYDTTNYAFTATGPRLEGTFEKKGYFSVWLWAQKWTMAYPRGAVFVDFKSPTNAQSQPKE